MNQERKSSLKTISTYTTAQERKLQDSGNMSVTLCQLDAPGLPQIDYKEVFKQLELQNPKDVSLDEHFTPDELNSLSKIEKLRYRNMKLNFQMMIQFGIPMKKPDFMLRRKKKPPPPPSDSESDQEWTPALEKPKLPIPTKAISRGRKKWMPPTKVQTVVLAEVKEEVKVIKAKMRQNKKNKNFETLPSTPSVESKSNPVTVYDSEDSDEQFEGFTEEEIRASEDNARRVKARNDRLISLLKSGAITPHEIDGDDKPNIDKKKDCKAKDLKKNRTKRYPRRSVPRLDYSELEVPDDDAFLFCEQCEQEHKGECPVHGPLKIIYDTQTDEDDTLKSDHSIPKNLILKESTIEGAGTGVFTCEPLERGVRFGPYAGVIIPEYGDIQAHSSGYCWLLFKDNKASHYVDAQFKSCSNWMRYVNCARWESEQNLLAFQYCGEIFYRTIEDIEAGKELMVWYGSDYASELGICHGTPRFTNRAEKSIKSEYTAKNQLASGIKLEINTEIGKEDEMYRCAACGHELKYASEARVKSHNTHCKRYIKANQINLHGYRCHKCQRKFPTSDLYEQHQKICGLMDKQKQMNTFQNQSEILCGLCGRMNFKTQLELESHLADCISRRHKCEVCGKGFTRSDSLTNHMRTHTKERPYKCEVCGKGFTRSGSLTNHMRTHTKERPYKCEVCGKGFTQSGHLTNHMRTHTKETPYKCEVCGKGFTQSGDLTKHMRTHTKETPYKCEVCGKGFTVSGSLTRHMRSHTKERPYMSEKMSLYTQTVIPET